MIKASLFISTLLAQAAFAGQRLYFKAGAIDTTKLDAAPMNMRHSLRLTANTGRTFVIQFVEKIRDQDRRNLLTLGAKILRYLPDDALVVTCSPQEARTIAISSRAIRAVLPYQPQWRLSPEIGPGSVFNAGSVQQVFIRTFPGADDIADQIAAIGAKVEVVSGRQIVATLTRAELDRVALIDGIEWIQPNPELRPLVLSLPPEDVGNSARSSANSKALTGFETGTKLMNFETAWSRGLTGRGQIVAMADTGLDRGDTANIHGDFVGRVPQGFVFGLFSKSWEDPMGHGTHVAGSVLGSGSLAGGALKGGAYEATLLPESMWSPMLGNLSVPAKLRDLFSKAYDTGARIHTNSWGSPRNPGAYDGFAQSVDEFMAANPDMLVVFAAGNSGVDADKDGRIDANSIGSPATAKNVLTVGASKNYVLSGGIQKKLKELKIGQEAWGVEPLASSMLSETAKGLAAFSSRGPTADGRIKPEVVAPGTNILSTRSHHKDAELLWGEYNSEYLWAGGTSMAAPLTAGAAAVVRQYLIDHRKIANPSAALIKGVLMHTARDLYPGQFGAVGKAAGQELLTTRPNFDEGYGLVDMDRATDLGNALLIDDRTGVAAGEVHTYPVHVSARSKLVATMVYTDAPAAAAAGKSLVNDLDLVVVDASGAVITLDDHTNNSEIIEREIPAGDYEIRVKGVNVPQGPAAGKQPYALILSVN